MRWGGFTAHAFLFGSALILQLVLRPALEGLSLEGWGPEIRRLGARLEALTRAALTASLLVTSIALLLQLTLVAGVRKEDPGASALSSVLSSNFGLWHAVRYPLLIALGVLLLGQVGSRLDAKGGRGYLLAWGALSLALLATSSFAGHAAVGSPGPLSILNDLLHQASGATWFAGIVLLAAILPEVWRGRSEEEQLRVLAPATIRFSSVALVSIAVVAITGTFNSFLHMGALEDLWTTAYGRFLALKILLFLVILGLGAGNLFVVRRRLRKDVRSAPRSLLRRAIAAELAIALALFAASGVLTGLSRTKPAAQVLERR